MKQVPIQLSLKYWNLVQVKLVDGTKADSSLREKLQFVSKISLQRSVIEERKNSMAF